MASKLVRFLRPRLNLNMRQRDRLLREARRFFRGGGFATERKIQRLDEKIIRALELGIYGQLVPGPGPDPRVGANVQYKIWRDFRDARTRAVLDGVDEEGNPF